MICLSICYSFDMAENKLDYGMISDYPSILFISYTETRDNVSQEKLLMQNFTQSETTFVFDFLNIVYGPWDLQNSGLQNSTIFHRFFQKFSV